MIEYTIENTMEKSVVLEFFNNKIMGKILSYKILLHVYIVSMYIHRISFVKKLNSVYTVNPMTSFSK